MHKKCHVSENTSVVNVLTSPKDCRNLQKSTFIQIFHDSELDWVRAKFEILGLLLNTLTTHYFNSRTNRENLPLPIQRQLSEKLKSFSEFFIKILVCTLNLEHFARNKPHSSSIFEYIDSEKRENLNAKKVLFLKTLP